jgi:hypothetical protein
MRPTGSRLEVLRPQLAHTLRVRVRVCVSMWPTRSHHQSPPSKRSHLRPSHQSRAEQSIRTSGEYQKHQSRAEQCIRASEHQNTCSASSAQHRVNVIARWEGEEGAAQDSAAQHSTAQHLFSEPRSITVPHRRQRPLDQPRQMHHRLVEARRAPLILPERALAASLAAAPWLGRERDSLPRAGVCCCDDVRCCCDHVCCCCCDHVFARMGEDALGGGGGRGGWREAAQRSNARHRVSLTARCEAGAGNTAHRSAARDSTAQHGAAHRSTA